MCLANHYDRFLLNNVESNLDCSVESSGGVDVLNHNSRSAATRGDIRQTRSTSAGGLIGNHANNRRRVDVAVGEGEGIGCASCGAECLGGDDTGKRVQRDSTRRACSGALRGNKLRFVATIAILSQGLDVRYVGGDRVKLIRHVYLSGYNIQYRKCQPTRIQLPSLVLVWLNTDAVRVADIASRAFLIAACHRLVHLVFARPLADVLDFAD